MTTSNREAKGSYGQWAAFNGNAKTDAHRRLRERVEESRQNRPKFSESLSTWPSPSDGDIYNSDRLYVGDRLDPKSWVKFENGDKLTNKTISMPNIILHDEHRATLWFDGSTGTLKVNDGEEWLTAPVDYKPVPGSGGDLLERKTFDDYQRPPRREPETRDPKAPDDGDGPTLFGFLCAVVTAATTAFGVYQLLLFFEVLP